MRLVQTKDGSYTFYSNKYGETYHSISGALEESFKKYVEPCKIKDGDKILDICFGLGYNSLAAIHSVKNLQIIALENDSKILNKIQKICMDNKLKEDFEKIKFAAKNLYYQNEKIKIKILLGDARKNIKKIKERFDAVFLDPFSPLKCPELWTKEFFIDIFKIMKIGGILATYSCAKNIRKNLNEAGFEIHDGPCVGRKSPNTVAIKLN
ncbi:MAG: MnmC family methyltransferase [Nanoarchaeota archaeon]|nr:MnmC family methyltransferase [Nanoarchaeota archaeon]